MLFESIRRLQRSRTVHRQNQFTSKDFSIKRQQIKDTLTNNKFFTMRQPVRNPLRGLDDFVLVNIMFKFNTNFKGFQYRSQYCFYRVESINKDYKVN